MNALQTCTSNGLSTDQHKISVAGTYRLYASSNVVEPSGLVITLSQTGSASASFVSPTTSSMQKVVTVNGYFNCQPGDIVSVVVTSSAPADQPPSDVKTTISLQLI